MIPVFFRKASGLLPVALAFAVFSFAQAVSAEEFNVAVAANFTAPAKEIAAAFQKESGDKAVLSFGSTGQLYAQIHEGAPFAVFLAADEATPQKLLNEKLAVQGSGFAYALGSLALWSPMQNYVDSKGKILEFNRFAHLAIADPAKAPYGRAAVETLQKLGLYADVKAKLVQGNNVAQAYQFVASGNAELGFVALSQIQENGHLKGGSAWLVPGTLHAPILQGAVLLAKGANNKAARAFLEFLKEPEAAKIMASYGYQNPPGAAKAKAKANAKSRGCWLCKLVG
jgi:molybdate transport system substrate-binding protein